MCFSREAFGDSGAALVNLLTLLDGCCALLALLLLHSDHWLAVAGLAPARALGDGSPASLLAVLARAACCCSAIGRPVR